MPRFSAKAKEIHDETVYYTDMVKAKSLLKELNNPLDIAFGKLFIANHIHLFQQLDEFLEILTEVENENKRLKDQFLQFMINIFYYRYYTGMNIPIVSKEHVEKYFDNIEQSYQDMDYKDDWEKYYCIGWYYSTKAWYAWRIKEDLSNAIKLQKKCIEARSKTPEDGEYYSDSYHNNLGYYYYMSGDFDEAEKSYNLAFSANKKYNNIYQLWGLDNLSELNFIKGDLQKAKELIDQRLDVAKRFETIYGIFSSLTKKAFYLYQEGNYDEAIKAYQESLVYRKQHGDRIHIFLGYYHIFNFYYQRFKVTRDKAFLTQAEQTLIDLQELSKTHSDNKTMVNYANYAQALIFKHGNIIKKAKAIVTLQELIEFYTDNIYPDDIGTSLNLLELLFEDVIQSEDQDTINQIDELMVRISKVPLRNNPQAIFGFISKHVVLAKYTYYIKGDPSAALDILNDAKDRMNAYKLDNLVNELEAEIQVLETEFSKWEHLDISVKDRIKKSEFTRYIQQALKIVDRQSESAD
ncbi:MAG: tetratricopeptide repeat protein [Candidatus Kariarchaeaceae archaeon]|jgi:tetratricopeptide (TPR) repeat protein